MRVLTPYKVEQSASLLQATKSPDYLPRDRLNIPRRSLLSKIRRGVAKIQALRGQIMIEHASDGKEKVKLAHRGELGTMDLQQGIDLKPCCLDCTP
ncbi:hypothetical protein BDV18DRAFT_32962 [Aspergillus unguis]